MTQHLIKFHFTFLIILLLTNASIAQKNGGQNRIIPPSDPPTPGQQRILAAEEKLDICDRVESFVPVIPEYHPIKTIRLAIHVFQKNDGTGNFQDTPQDRAILQSFIDDVNRRYSNLDIHQPALKSPHIKDSRLRFTLTRIYFHRDSLAWNMDDNGPCGTYWPCGKKLYKQYIQENETLSALERDSVMHIFMGANPSFPFKTGGAASGIGSKTYIWSRGYYWYYNEHPYLESARDYVKGNIAHEIGHMLGLTHTFQGGECTTMEDPPMPDKSKQEGSNNLMDYGSWTSLTACQLGHAHRNIARNLGNLQDIIVKDYIELQPGETIKIKSGEDITWNSPKNLRGNLIIEKGAKLTINCSIGLPAGAEVTVETGGWLVLENGASLHGNEDKLWNGVRVKGKNNWFKFYRADGSPRNFGRLQIKGSGKIENIKANL